MIIPGFFNKFITNCDTHIYKWIYLKIRKEVSGDSGGGGGCDRGDSDDDGSDTVGGSGEGGGGSSSKNGNADSRGYSSQVIERTVAVVGIPLGNIKGRDNGMTLNWWSK